MNKQIQQQNSIKTWLSLVVRMSLFAVALLWPTGTWQWWEAWLLVALWSVFGIFMTRYLLRHDPALLVERMKLYQSQYIFMLKHPTVSNRDIELQQVG